MKAGGTSVTLRRHDLPRPPGAPPDQGLSCGCHMLERPCRPIATWSLEHVVPFVFHRRSWRETRRVPSGPTALEPSGVADVVDQDRSLQATGTGANLALMTWSGDREIWSG